MNTELSLEAFKSKLDMPLSRLYKNEVEYTNALCFVQPYPGGKLVEYTWGEIGTKVRQLASYIQSLNLPPRSNIALISANTAYWIITDMAIWMAGHCSVPLFPNLTAQTVKQILEHSESQAVFVGKLPNPAAC